MGRLELRLGLGQLELVMWYRLLEWVGVRQIVRMKVKGKRVRL